MLFSRFYITKSEISQAKLEIGETRDVLDSAFVISSKLPEISGDSRFMRLCELLLWPQW